ncbi:MAG: T9SS type A sorting domain-containing protein [Bacteroidetes bacterium]|nr:T9SS type A sorting domain-containing protein [Bacteroidota bacterium]
MEIDLKKYGVVASAVLAAGSAQASVFHTDINPDSVLATAGDNFAIDLNGDLVPDFNISLDFIGGYSSVGLQNLASGNYYAFQLGTITGYGVYSFVAALSFGSVIDNTAISNWGTSDGIPFKSNVGIAGGGLPNPNGFFHGETKYAGVKFKISGNDHFGWILLSVGDTYDSVTVHGFAYETCPGTAITAGQTFGTCVPVSVEDNEPNQSEITTHNNTITIAGADGTAGIYNLLGQEIAKANLPASIRVESGVYLVRVNSEGKHFTKKIVLSDN